MGTVARVTSLPDCDLCTAAGQTTKAAYDAKTLMGPWAYMCEQHFQSHGMGRIGTGWGQRLVVAEPPTTAERRAALLAAIDSGDMDAADEAVGDGDITDLL